MQNIPEVKRGGRRVGAGRLKGSGRYGEPTVPIRVPATLAGEVEALIRKAKRKLPLRLSLLLVAGLMMTGCATSSSAGCIAYFQNAKGTNSSDSVQTIDNFSDLDLAMMAACQ
jgi:hypothetical protein